MAVVTEAWIRIDDWLRRHAPVSAAVLAPPAGQAEIAAAEDVLGFALPAELVESLRRHNGQRQWANMFPGKPPLSVVRIVQHRQMCMEIAEDDDRLTPLDGDTEPWWHELWVPFAESDGDAQVIDLRPGPGQGRLGWAVRDDCGDFDDAWPSLGAYLTEVANSLATGTPVNRWCPYLTVDGDLWWDLPDETELNCEPLRPAPTD